MSEFSTNLEILQEENFEIKAPKEFKTEEWQSRSGRPGKVLFSKFSSDYINSECYITVSTLSKDPITSEIRKRVEQYIGESGFDFLFTTIDEHNAVFYCHEEEIDYRTYHAFVVLSDKKAVLVDVVFNMAYDNAKEVATDIIHSLKSKFKEEVTEEELRMDAERLEAESQALASRDAEKRAKIEEERKQQELEALEQERLAEEQERLAKEQFEAEQERLAKEQFEAEQERLAKEQFEAEQKRIAQEELAAEQERVAQQMFEAAQEKLAQELKKEEQMQQEAKAQELDMAQEAEVMEQEVLVVEEEIEITEQDMTEEESETEPEFEDSEEGNRMKLVYDSIKSNGKMTVNDLQSIGDLRNLARMEMTQLMNKMTRNEIVERFEEEDKIYFALPGYQAQAAEQASQAVAEMSEMDRYKLEYEQYKQALAEWKKSKDFFGRTELPKPIEPVKPKKHK